MLEYLWNIVYDVWNFLGVYKFKKWSLFGVLKCKVHIILVE